MIDMALLREQFNETKARILHKEPNFPVDQLVGLDQEVRKLKTAIDEIRKEKNSLANLGAQGATAEVRARAHALSEELKKQEDALSLVEKSYKDLALSCPNLGFDDIPSGGKEANKVVRTHGTAQQFTFTPKHHMQLNEKNAWFDMQKAAAMTGTQFVIYLEQGAKIIYALTHMMLKNNVKHGFKPVIPPALIAEKALYNPGNLPKFAGDYYSLPNDGLCLIPTSEVSLTNLHVNETFAPGSLPVRYTSWTSCFRREAGGYGANDRGLIRIHQFEKVELYSITQQEDSVQELETMVSCAEQLLQELGLHYRVSLLAAQDCSFQSAKTYDIEVWLPGQNQFYEISSCSNCTDFQARRSGIRYKTSNDAKPQLVHTLNASSLALPRLMVALMETYQQEDGSIKLPPALTRVMDALW